jgi:hypothetical protein
LGLGFCFFGWGWGLGLVGVWLMVFLWSSLWINYYCDMFGWCIVIDRRVFCIFCLVFY